MASIGRRLRGSFSKESPSPTQRYDSYGRKLSAGSVSSLTYGNGGSYGVNGQGEEYYEPEQEVLGAPVAKQKKEGKLKNRMSMALKKSFGGPTSPRQESHRQPPNPSPSSSTAPVLPPLQLALTPSGSPRSSTRKFSHGQKDSFDSVSGGGALGRVSSLQRAQSHASNRSNDSGPPPPSSSSGRAGTTRGSVHRDSNASLRKSEFTPADPRVSRRSHAPYAPTGASPPLPPLPPKGDDAPPPLPTAYATSGYPERDSGPPPRDSGPPPRQSRQDSFGSRKDSLSQPSSRRNVLSSPEAFTAADMSGLGLGFSAPPQQLRQEAAPPSPKVARPTRAPRNSSMRQSTSSVASSRRSSASSHRRKSSAATEMAQSYSNSSPRQLAMPSLVIAEGTPRSPASPSPASPISRTIHRSASEGSIALAASISSGRSSSLSGGGSLPPGAGLGAAPPPSVLDSVGITVGDELSAPVMHSELSNKSRDRVSVLRKRASALPPARDSRPNSLLVPTSKAAKRHTIGSLNTPALDLDFRREGGGGGSGTASNRNSTFKPLPPVGTLPVALQRANTAPSGPGSGAPPAGYVVRPMVTMCTQTPDWESGYEATPYVQREDLTPEPAYGSFPAPAPEDVAPPPPAHSPPTHCPISPSIYSVASFDPRGRTDARLSRSSFWASEEIARFGHPQGYHEAPVPPLPTEIPDFPPPPPVPEEPEPERPAFQRRRSSAAKLIDRSVREKQLARASFYDPGNAGSSQSLGLDASQDSPKLSGLSVPSGGSFGGFSGYSIPRAAEPDVEKENFDTPYLAANGAPIHSPSAQVPLQEAINSPIANAGMFVAPTFGANPFSAGATGSSSHNENKPDNLIAPTSHHVSRSRSTGATSSAISGIRTSPALSSSSWASTANASVRAPTPTVVVAPAIVTTPAPSIGTAAFGERRKSVSASASEFRTPENKEPVPAVVLRKASVIAIPSAASKRTSMYAAVTAAANSLNDMIAGNIPPPAAMANISLPAMPSLDGIGAAIKKSASAANLAIKEATTAPAAPSATLMPSIVLPTSSDDEGGLGVPQARTGGRSKDERAAKGRSFFLVQALQDGPKKSGEGLRRSYADGEESSGAEESESDDEEFEAGVVRRVVEVRG